MEFSADDYAVLVAHLALFWKFSEPFLCLIGMSHSYTLDEDTYPTFLYDDGTEMDLFAFIQVADPTKVKVREREHPEEEARLFDSTVGRLILLLPVSQTRSEKAKTRIVTEVRSVVDENVVAKRPKRPHKKRQVVTDASGSSHPPKKLRGTTEILVRTLLVVNLLSATPEHESGVPTISIIGLNIRTIGASERFIISLDSSYHSSTNASGAEGDSIIRSAVVPPVMTEAVVISHAVNIPSVPEMGIKVTSHVHASLFHDYDSTKTVKADTAGYSYSAKQDLSMGSRELNSKALHQGFVSQWNVLNDSFLDDYDVSQEFVDHLAPPALFSQIRKMDYHHLFTEFNAMEKIHAAEIDVLKQRNVPLENEKESIDGKVAELQSSVFANDLELKDLNVMMSFLRSQKDGLVDQVVQLDADLLEMALYVKDKFYPHIITTISGHRWLLAHGIKLAVIKCLNSQEYLLALGAAISRVIKKRMQDGLSAGIDHGKAGRNPADVVTYNPAAEADYNFAL
nr:putative transposase (putative), gypsy type [Tanacetum cinerariifolium]